MTRVRLQLNEQAFIRLMMLHGDELQHCTETVVDKERHAKDLWDSVVLQCRLCDRRRYTARNGDGEEEIEFFLAL
jgi:hypothetical protein